MHVAHDFSHVVEVEVVPGLVKFRPYFLDLGFIFDAKSANHLLPHDDLMLDRHSIRVGGALKERMMRIYLCHYGSRWYEHGAFNLKI